MTIRMIRWSKIFGDVFAYEHWLYEKHGRNQSASRTRRKIENKGVHQTMIDWATAAKPTEAFTALVGRGLFDLTGEYMVLKYADRFDDEVVDAAKARLNSAGWEA